MRRLRDFGIAVGFGCVLMGISVLLALAGMPHESDRDWAYLVAASQAVGAVVCCPAIAVWRRLHGKGAAGPLVIGAWLVLGSGVSVLFIDAGWDTSGRGFGGVFGVALIVAGIAVAVSWFVWKVADGLRG